MRPRLELPLRSLVTIAVLVARGKDAQLPLHIRGGLRAGLTPAHQGRDEPALSQPFEYA